MPTAQQMLVMVNEALEAAAHVRGDGVGGGECAGAVFQPLVEEVVV